MGFRSHFCRELLMLRVFLLTPQKLLPIVYYKILSPSKSETRKLTKILIVKIENMDTL